MSEPSQKYSLGRALGLIAVLIIVMMTAPLFSKLSIVFGWTNPTEAPPGGSGILTALNGKLGINTANPSTTLTINGELSIDGDRIRDVAAPIDGKDAVNKDYLIEQVPILAASSSGGGGWFLSYGVSTSQTPVGFWRAFGGALPSSCFRNISTGVLACNQLPTAPGKAGEGAPACPTGWTEAYAGFGPFGNIILWNGNLTSNGVQEPEEDANPDMAVAATYSVCATTPYLHIPVTQTTIGYQQGQSSLLSACTNYDANNPGRVNCNTCRVCVK